jgi:hypothetical protein
MRGCGQVGMAHSNLWFDRIRLDGRGRAVDECSASREAELPECGLAQRHSHGTRSQERLSWNC